MGVTIAAGLLFALGLILANAFFVAVEFALVAVDRTRLELLAAEGSRSARLSIGVLRKLSFNLSGAQLGITITSLALGLLTEPVVAAALEPLVGSVLGESSSLAVSVVLALVGTTMLQMVIGELVPKSVAISRPMPTTLRYAPAFRVYSVVLKPIIWVCNASANAILRLVGVQPTEELSGVHSKDDLRRVVRLSSEGGTLKQNTARLLERSFSFGEKVAADALTPRVAMKTLPLDSSVGDLIGLSTQTGLSRFPVHGGDPDHLLGVVHVKDVFGLPREDRAERPLSVLVKPVAMVPESKPLDELLGELREAAAHLAVVLDEYGGTAGLVTIEDLVEEIVGDIADEHDPPDALLRTQAWKGAQILSGLLHPDEVVEACGFKVPPGRYETLAGFVLHELGHIPTAGEEFTSSGWRIRVVDVDRRRVSRVQLVSPPPGAVDSGREA